MTNNNTRAQQQQYAKHHARRIAILLGMLTPAMLWAAQEPADVTPPESFWATGNQHGVYLVVTDSDVEEPQFRIFSRDTVGRSFRSSGGYPGRPIAVAVMGTRLCVFLESGRSSSYSLADVPRTERRLPIGLRALASTTLADQPYLVVIAQQPITLPLLQEPSAAADPGDRSGNTADHPIGSPGAIVQEPLSSPEDAAEPQPVDAAAATRSNDSIATAIVSSGDRLLNLLEADVAVITLDRDRRWCSLTTSPLLLDPCGPLSIAVNDDAIHVFARGLSKTATGDTFGDLLYYRVGRDQLDVPQTLPLDNVTGVWALSVSGQLRVIAAVGIQSADPMSSEYHMFWPIEGSWHKTIALSETSDRLLTAEPQAVRFAVFGTGIGVFRSSGLGQYLFGHYGPTGELTSPIEHEIITTATQLPKLLEWLGSPPIAILMMAVGMLVVVARRKEAFGELPELPQNIQPAPLIPRLLAHVLDTIPPFFITLLAFGNAPEAMELQRQMGDYSTLFELNQSNNVLIQNPELFHFALLVTCTYILSLVVYLAICELWLSTTPGKMVFGLVVVNYKGQRISPGQAICRNLFRLFELYPQLPLLTLLAVILTRRRQRIADMAARTIVARNLVLRPGFRKDQNTTDV